MIALALAGAMFASQSGVASAKEGTLFAISTGKKYMSGTYTVGRNKDTVFGTVSIKNDGARWTASAANDGKYAYYSFGTGVSSSKLKNTYINKRMFRDNKLKSHFEKKETRAVTVFYW